MKVSDCCGAQPMSNGDFSTADYGICPRCKDHCEYIEEDMFHEYKIYLNECIKNKDVEVAHERADMILKEIALDTELSYLQRKELIEMYDKVTKWYA